MTSPLLSSIDRVHEGGSHRVKDREKALLYREIAVGKTPTRLALARRLSIRPSSVSEAVQELVDDGLVKETNAPLNGRLGRPQVILVARPDRYVAISAYIDSRELKAVLVTLREEVIAEEVHVLPPETGNREMTAAICDLLTRLRAGVPAGSELVGAGLSLIGTVDSHIRTWMAAARWPRLHDLDLSSVEERVGIPLSIRRTNEAELEYFLACNPRARSTSSLLFHWGFGIGAAVAFRGTLLTSSLGRFGEIGHTRCSSAADTPCLCGARGCLETVAALWALIPVLRARLGEVPEDEKELAPLLGDVGLLRVPEIRTALGAVQDALVVLSMIFYPDRIILSGPFTESPLVFRKLTEGLRRALPEYARGASSFAVIPGGMPGCRRGGANPLFRETLGRALRRRT
jgi:predicted NBD/HSP70 family sugar kinase